MFNQCNQYFKFEQFTNYSRILKDTRNENTKGQQQQNVFQGSRT